MTALGIALIVVSVMAAAASVRRLLRPRASWWATDAWRHRDPAANEPSVALQIARGAGGLLASIAAASYGIWIVVTFG